MDAEARARVARLKKWIKENRKDLCGSDGEPSASKVAADRTDSMQPNQWSDLLGERKKSFGAKSARRVESLLDMPPLHLEGGGWPFEEVDFDLWSQLTERQKGRVEKAMADEIAAILAESAHRANGAGG